MVHNNEFIHKCLSRGWFIRIHRCAKAEAKHEDSLSFPVFVCVFTKMKKMPGAPMVCFCYSYYFIIVYYYP